MGTQWGHKETPHPYPPLKRKDLGLPRFACCLILLGAEFVLPTCVLGIFSLGYGEGMNYGRLLVSID